jgi:hypothetical protein
MERPEQQQEEPYRIQLGIISKIFLLETSSMRIAIIEEAWVRIIFRTFSVGDQFNANNYNGGIL